MKKCELCNSTAKMYCDSDQASLCWDCDTRVHTANFLVAKHSRTLLCHACQSPTPWTASGPKLGPSTVSVCQACANRSSSTSIDGDRDLEHTRDDDDDDDEDGSEDEDDQDDNDEDDDEDSSDDGGDEDDDGDNQVVPFSSTPLPPPLVSSSSSSEDSSKRSSQRRDRGGTSSRFGFFSNNSNQNGRFSNDFSIERSRHKGDCKISSRTSQ